MLALTGLVAACGASPLSSARSVGQAISPGPGPSFSARIPAAPASAMPITSLITVLDLPYSAAQALDLYAPSGPGPRPIVVILHGMNETRADWTPFARAIAHDRAVVFNVEYRADELARPGGPEDAACAVRFARAQAPAYGGDPARVTLFGFSAGAVYGALAALAGDQFAGDCATRGVSALPSAFVGVAGPYDPTLLASDPRPPLRQTDPARYEELNPYTHLGGNPRLRVLLLHGADDAAAPPEMSTRFCAALAAAGYDATLTVVEGYGHEIPLSDSPAFRQIVRETLRFASVER